jgi:hypothetical protein
MLRNRPKQQRNDDAVDETTAHNQHHHHHRQQQISSLMVADDYDDEDDFDCGDEEDYLLRNGHNKNEGKDTSNSRSMFFCCRNNVVMLLNRRSWWRLDTRRRKIGLTVSIVSAIVVFYTALNAQRIIYEISIAERRVDNPFTRAKVFNPLRYLQVKYFDPKPSRNNIKNYRIIPAWGNTTMTTTSSSSSFVINMDRDQQRINKFYQRNGMGAKRYIQRYSAYEWMKATTTTGSKDAKKQQQQEQYQQQYPFVKHAIREGKYGDAGCFLSHILLIQEKLGDTQQSGNKDNSSLDYISIFEDDVDIMYTNKNDDGGLSVLAPGEADIIFLSPQSATKRIIVPWNDVVGRQQKQPATNSALRHREDTKTNDWRKDPPPGYPAVRVIGGYGAIGYIVTRKGAQKILDVATRTNEPLDLSFFTYSSLHVYLPLEQYNTVVHVGTASTRRNINH